MVGYNRTEDEKQNTEVELASANKIRPCRDGQTGGTTQVDAICPKCFKPLANPKVMLEPDRYGRELRKYLGFCPACSIGCETIQFKRGRRWVIHRYQVYAYIGTNIHCQAMGGWTTLNDLPEPAPIVVGPGGDFDNQITPQVGELLGKLRAALEGVCRVIECLMQSKGLK